MSTIRLLKKKAESCILLSVENLVFYALFKMHFALRVYEREDEAR